jgi:hypothetical protein
VSHLYNSGRRTHAIRAAETARHHNEKTPGRGVGTAGVHDESDVNGPDTVNGSYGVRPGPGGKVEGLEPIEE